MLLVLRSFRYSGLVRHCMLHVFTIYFVSIVYSVTAWFHSWGKKQLERDQTDGGPNRFLRYVLADIERDKDCKAKADNLDSEEKESIFDARQEYEKRTGTSSVCSTKKAVDKISNAKVVV